MDKSSKLEHPPHSERRRRASSLFSVNDYGAVVKEKQKEFDRKGRFLMTHCHDPLDLTAAEQEKAVDLYAEYQTEPLRRKQNTYRMKPEKPFNHNEVVAVIQDELLEFQDLIYSADTCSKRAVTVANQIKKRVQSLGYDRYKIVVFVNIGTKEGAQGVKVCSRSIWDPNTDNYASVSVTNSTLFAIANVYAIYCE